MKFRRALYDLFSVSATLEMGQREFSRKIGVAPSQFMMLRIIAEGHLGDGTTVTEIAKNLYLHSPFVVLQTGRLVKAGLVKRTKNPRDMRSLLLRLTKKGEILIASLNQVVEAANDTLFGWMSSEEFGHFSTIIAKVAQHGPATLNVIALTPPAGPVRPNGSKDIRP